MFVHEQLKSDIDLNGLSEKCNEVQTGSQHRKRALKSSKWPDFSCWFWLFCCPGDSRSDSCLWFGQSQRSAVMFRPTCGHYGYSPGMVPVWPLRQFIRPVRPVFFRHLPADLWEASGLRFVPPPFFLYISFLFQAHLSEIKCFFSLFCWWFTRLSALKDKCLNSAFVDWIFDLGRN